MSDQRILPGIANAIFSRASEAGATLSVSPDGRTIDPSGLVVAPVSRLARRAKGKVVPILAISGPHGSGSSASVALTQFLASRLRQRLDTVGSILYRLTWKEKATPSGREYFLLRASTRRTDGTGFGSWPMAGWTTPTAQDHSRGTAPPRPHDTGIPLSQQVSGLTRNGSGAETEKPGQLHPAFSRWLMGYPAEWCLHAPVARR